MTIKRKGRPPQKPVLVCENIFVHRDTYSYVVSEQNGTELTCDVHGKKCNPTYHPDLPSAIHEVSKRLFDRKLEKRAEAGQYDFNSLLQLVREHKEEMNEMFGI